MMDASTLSASSPSDVPSGVPASFEAKVLDTTLGGVLNTNNFDDVGDTAAGIAHARQRRNAAQLHFSGLAESSEFTVGIRSQGRRRLYQCRWNHHRDDARFNTACGYCGVDHHQPNHRHRSSPGGRSYPQIISSTMLGLGIISSTVTRIPLGLELSYER